MMKCDKINLNKKINFRHKATQNYEFEEILHQTMYTVMKLQCTLKEKPF